MLGNDNELVALSPFKSSASNNSHASLNFSNLDCRVDDLRDDKNENFDGKDFAKPISSHNLARLALSSSSEELGCKSFHHFAPDVATMLHLMPLLNPFASSLTEVSTIGG